MRFAGLILLLFFSFSFSNEGVHIVRNVKVDGGHGIYRLTGEARLGGNNLYYNVDDGHNEIFQEKKMVFKDDHSQWQPFEMTINIPKERLPENGSLLLTFYTKDNSSQAYSILLEKFPNTEKPTH